MDDASLWKKISSGDAEAFDDFYRESAPRLRRLLRHLIRNDQAAEDVMQNTFTELWRRPRGFDPERGALRAYVFGAARKQAAEWWRKRRPEDELSFDEPTSCSIEASSVVTDAFGRLDQDQRTLLWLREVEGQSYTELAAILDIPVGTVRSRLFAAREALRAIWHEQAPALKGGR